MAPAPFSSACIVWQKKRYYTAIRNICLVLSAARSLTMRHGLFRLAGLRWVDDERLFACVQVCLTMSSQITYGPGPYC